MSVANCLLSDNSAAVEANSTAIAANSVNVALNTTSIAKLQPLLIVDTVADTNINSGTASYAFVGKPQGGAVDGIYLFSISFELQTSSVSLDVLYSIENTAAGANQVLSEKAECSTGCNVFFSYSGVVEITSVSPNVGIVIEPTTTGAVTNLTSGSMVWTRISAA